MNQILEKIINSVKKNKEKCVVFNETTGEGYVIMTFEEYELLAQRQTAPALDQEVKEKEYLTSPVQLDTIIREKGDKLGIRPEDFRKKEEILPYPEKTSNREENKKTNVFSSLPIVSQEEEEEMVKNFAPQKPAAAERPVKNFSAISEEDRYYFEPAE